MSPEIENLLKNSKSLVTSQLFALANNSRVANWIDANVMMFASNESKQKLLTFPVLRTVLQVVIEVNRKPEKTRYLLDRFSDCGGVVVAPDSFASLNLEGLHNFVLGCASSYSPLTRAAIERNSKFEKNESPIPNNSLVDITDEASFLETTESMLRLTQKLGLTSEHEKECTKLRKAWLKYHNERERGIREKKYLFTDERLVASALTDGFAHNCVSLVLTNDWDAFAIVKQFADNVLDVSVQADFDNSKSGLGEAASKLFNERCEAFDWHVELRRQAHVEAIADGDLFSGCKPGDLFIWHYPSDSFLSFGFPKWFKGYIMSRADSKESEESG